MRERVVLGLDTVPIHRPLAHTYRDRTWVHVPNLPPSTRPVKPGWEFSTLGSLPTNPCSHVYWLDASRVDSTQRAIDVGALQLGRVLPHLGVRFPLCLGSLDKCDQLLRSASNRRLYRRPPPPTHKQGCPRKDGDQFQGKDTSTHVEPDSVWSGTDHKGKSITVSCWKGLHLQTCRAVELAVIRVRREAAKDTKRDPKDSWFWWGGGQLPPPESLPELYARRSSLEHAYRFDKQDMLLAEPLLEVMYHPWDRRGTKPTPRQLRRGIGSLFAQVGTPVRAVRPRGKSLGGAKGVLVPPKPLGQTLIKRGNIPSRPHPPPYR